MAKTPQPPPGGDEPEAADAAFLFEDEAPRRSPAPPRGPRPAQDVDDYAVLGDETPAETGPVPPVPVPPPIRPKASREPKSKAKAEPTRAA